MATYAQVALLRPSRYLDLLYTYKIPYEANEISIGARVKINFNNRIEEGFIFSLSTENTYQGEVKPILEILPKDLWLTPELVELIKWVSEYYLCSITEALNLVSSPEKIYLPSEVLCAVVDEHRLKQKVEKSKCLKNDKALANLLKEKSGWLKNSVRVRKLIAEGLLTVIEKKLPAPPEIVLSDSQSSVYRRIVHDLGKDFVGLLHGVTGSGKTEIYLKLAGDVIKQGKQVLFLLPEIGITTQMVARVKKYFPDHTLVYHSRLNSREKFFVWHEVRQGKPVLVLGPRSAAFLPFIKLGLIILDEEHELSYKQEESPKYHVREVVYWRAKRLGVPLLLGTATPSLETYAAVLSGAIKYYRLEKRYQNRPSPKIFIVDMFKEAKEGNTGIISRTLNQKIEERLVKGEQVFLFLNRRGFAPTIMCRSCGYFYRCPDCDVAVTYHKEEKNFQCHYCGKKIVATRKCPVCQENSLDLYGYGTERVEEELQRLYQARILRVDYDTMKGKDSYEKIILAMKRKEVDILVGTQMLAKGFDFPDLTLVGVLNADQSLNLPDFRAGERSFNLLTQVAGRAGRGIVPGEVVIQTFNPENYVLKAVKDGNYQQYALKELFNRKLAGYPPFNKIFRIIIAGRDEQLILEGAKCFADLLKFNSERLKANIEIIGPASAPYYKLKRNYRYHILIKGNKGNIAREVLKNVVLEFKTTSFYSKLTLALDLSPQIFF
ncbi:replication restart helicase PriA [Carboxydothermus pertinax]|uniref:Replication restart protein PriA n=1 Tax=Carboxydothermus pertinax TaxID=870242 RepID=A0A1L8CXW0_9THEO|nr:primosomal protein N' [Carboxydothermus pertinax]GAV23727.1 primosomal protein N' [Carboxydothermus pertinax]